MKTIISWGIRMFSIINTSTNSLFKIEKDTSTELHIDPYLSFYKSYNSRILTPMNSNNFTELHVYSNSVSTRNVLDLHVYI